MCIIISYRRHSYNFNLRNSNFNMSKISTTSLNAKDEIIAKLQNMICSECGIDKCINNYGASVESWYQVEYLWNIHLRFGEKSWPKCARCLSNRNEICVGCCLSRSDSPLLLAANSTPESGIIWSDYDGGWICVTCQEQTKRYLKIGIDNGGVLSMHKILDVTDVKNITDDNKSEEGHVSESELNMPGVVKGLTILKSVGHKLSMLSFCGKSRAIKTKSEITSLHPNLFDEFIFTKDKRFKSGICEHLGLDVFIDDTYEVIIQVASENQSMLVIWFQGDPSFSTSPEEVHTVEGTINFKNIHVAKTWQDVVEICRKESLLDVPRKQMKGAYKQNIFRITADQWKRQVYII